VIVGNLVAPALNGRGIVELESLHSVRLRSNAALELLFQVVPHSAHEAERRGFVRIITYTRGDEGGTGLHAAGWTCEGPAGAPGVGITAGMLAPIRMLAS
jgi:hypothetical protein